ncbi:unnamed protein product, partial [Mesorhabditis belari]|uniref:Uncharacterized protein n=1 Tax=Mesorhabditis belari TaxID=2138241 RepID=A0AAF3EL88_9BILA
MNSIQKLFFFIFLLVCAVSSLPLVQRSQLEVPDEAILFPTMLEEIDFDKRDPEMAVWIDVPESLRFNSELPRTDRKWHLDEEMILSARRHPTLKTV